MKKGFNLKIILGIVFLALFFVSVGYSAFGANLSINGIVGNIRVKEDIRVTGFTVESLNNGATVKYQDYNVSSLLGNISLTEEDSSVTYKVSITNIGNVEMGIKDISGLPDNLTYKIDGYSLKDKICDVNHECKLGITSEFYLTIQYKEGAYSPDKLEYSFNINLQFKSFFTVTYDNIVNEGYPTEILEGEDLFVTFSSTLSNLSISMGSNPLVDDVDYTYSGKTLTIPNVTGNIVISRNVSVNLNVGDYVDYDAGVWTETVENSSMSLGGYTQGSSRNNGITCPSDTYNPVAKNGWRILDIATDGTMTLVSAGTLECYGNEWGQAEASVNYLMNHDYSMYVNSTYATSAGILTKELIDKVSGLNVDVGIDLTDDVYLAGGRYFLPYVQPGNTNNLLYVQSGGYVGGMGSYTYGIRIVVTLKSGVKIISGTGTEEDPYQISIDSGGVDYDRYGTITGYWENWKSDQAMRLRDVPDSYDIVALSFGLQGSSNGTIGFSLDQYLSEQLNYTEADFMNDIDTLQKKGKKVILSIGGSTSDVIINDDLSVERFVNSVYAIIQKYGLDGVDIDIENVIYEDYFVKAIRTLAEKVGSNFVLTFAPETVDFKVDRNGNLTGKYVTVFSKLIDLITIINMQMYNTGDQYGIDHVIYYPGDVDFLVAISDILITNGIPANKVGIGINTVSSKSGYVEPSVVIDAFKSLQQGGKVINGDYQISGAYSNFGGIMIFSINTDSLLNNKFIEAIEEGLKK